MFSFLPSSAFLIEHTTRASIDGDWEGFPDELAESIKGIRPMLVLLLLVLVRVVQSLN